MRHVAIGGAILFALAIIIGAFPAKADESRAAWFKSLKQPDTGYSCCDLSDCRVTEGAEWRQDGWWAPVFGTMTKMPPNKTLWRKVSPDGGAVICHGGMPETPVIFCFVPPAMGL